MTVELPNLPYEMKALEPYISEKTLTFHYGKHHATYVKNTNNLIASTPLADKSLPDIILTAAADTVLTGVFNNAAQCFNHDFFWRSLTPQSTKPSPGLTQAITRSFGSLEQLKEAFYQAATAQFGSGWAWLVADKDDMLKIMATGNAGTPLIYPSLRPLLCLDVWEHAYYLDYQNRRPDYVRAVLDHLLNWEFASQNFKQKKGA